MKAILFSVLTCLSFSSTALATDFENYNPDKTGQTNCSALLTKALADTRDGCLDIAAGKYLLESPVTLKGITIQALHGRATFTGPNKDTDLFLVPRVFNIKLVNLGFTNAKRAISSAPSPDGKEGYFAGAQVIGCSFFDLIAGVDCTCIQIVWFRNCAFSRLDYGVRGVRGYGGRSNGVYLEDCTFDFCNQWAVFVEGSPTVVRSCMFHGSKGGAVFLCDAYVATIENCYMEGMGMMQDTENPDGHETVHIGKRAFGATGIVTIRENQFNSCGGPVRIVVEDGCGLAAEHNFFLLNTKTSQVAIKSLGSKARVFERENYLENLSGIIIER